MKFDIVFAAVGGQGGLSISAIIASAAMEEGLFVKQAESHGMSQRGGAVQATLRLSDSPVQSALVPRGTGALILSMEPLESLRYLDLLGPDGWIFTSTTPLKNIDDYPPTEALLGKLRSMPRTVLVEADKLAREAGAARAANVAVMGAAAKMLPIGAAPLQRAIERTFARKGTRVVETNLKAFQLGKSSVA